MKQFLIALLLVSVTFNLSITQDEVDECVSKICDQVMKFEIRFSNPKIAKMMTHVGRLW